MKTKGKPTKKRPRRKQQSKKPSAQKQRLQDELARLISDVDEEGLIFLIKQAQVIIHNLQVDRINQEIEELEQRQPSAKRADASPPAVRRTADRRTARGSANVDIEEAANGKSFYLVFPDTRKILGVDEMRLLVRACYEPKRKSEAMNRMYRWMQRERRDIVSDGKIESNGSQLLEALFYRIREKYKLKD
jgi:TolA-binding protein